MEGVYVCVSEETHVCQKNHDTDSCPSTPESTEDAVGTSQGCPSGRYVQKQMEIHLRRHQAVHESSRYFQAKPVKNKQTNKQQPIPPKGNRKAPRNLRTPPMHKSPHNVHVPLLKLSQALLAPDSPFPDSEVSDSQGEARESSIQSVQPKVREYIWTVSKDHPRLE